MKRTPLKRKTPLRRKAMRRGKSASKYARRPRDLEFLAWVKTQPCSVLQEWPDKILPPGECSAAIEADHDSRGRGLSHKSDDRKAIPLCTAHHYDRTNHTGAWKYVDKERAREWFESAQRRTQANWAERNGGVPW